MDTKGAITPEMVASWVASAEPGAELVYAWGDDFPRSAPGVVAAKRQFAKGLVTFTSRKSPGRREYIMQRLQRRRLAAGESPKSTAAERAVMSILRHAASIGLPCPSNEYLAEAAGLRNAHQSSYIVRKLRLAAKIHVEFVGDKQRRRITITATGDRTAVAIEKARVQ